MADGEPTLGEVLRRLDEVSKQLTALAIQMAEDRRDAAKTFVRQDVYDARHGSLVRRVDQLETDSDEREKSTADARRQFLFMILSIAIPAVLAFLWAVNNFIATGGATP